MEQFREWMESNAHAQVICFVPTFNFYPLKYEGFPVKCLCLICLMALTASVTKTCFMTKVTLFDISSRFCSILLNSERTFSTAGTYFFHVVGALFFKRKVFHERN